MRYRLTVDMSKCDHCYKCEIKANLCLPGLISQYNGEGYITLNYKTDPECMLYLQNAMNACPHGAITVERIDD
ncbi:MAG: hypothetical protein PHD09_07865 [Candidatus Omnitrophica bacterium]|nr:hypothetical protein [Candidatus Omnitrophota bacterium]